MVLKRNFVYMGVTRGKRLVVLFGQKRALLLHNSAIMSSAAATSASGRDRSARPRCWSATATSPLNREDRIWAKELNRTIVARRRRLAPETWRGSGPGTAMHLSGLQRVKQIAQKS